MGGEFFVDNSISPFIVHIGLFDMYPESIVIDRSAEGESHNLMVYADGTAYQSQFVVMVQGIDYGAAFVVQIFFVVILPVSFVPFAFELQAFGYEFRGDRDVFVRIFFIEVVDMITFCLVFLPFQGCQVFTQVDIIEIIPFGNVEESSGDRFSSSSLASGVTPSMQRGCPCSRESASSNSIICFRFPCPVGVI